MSATESPADATGAGTLHTRRGNIVVDADGNLTGLWQVIKRELRTSAQVRAMCAGATRTRGRPSTRPIEHKTLQAWQRDAGFPAPVLELDGTPYYSRTEVEEWLAVREQTLAR